MGRQGATRGERRRLPRYQRGSGKPWHVTGILQAPNAEKLLDICDAAGLSAAEVVNRLVELMPLDPATGLPPEWKMPTQEALEIAT